MSTLVAQTISNGTVSTSTANVINGAKAWVNYNASTQTIRASYNVSSITRVVQGQFRVNFTNAFADIGYSGVVTARGVAGLWQGLGTEDHDQTRTTSMFPVVAVRNDTGANFDTEQLNVAVFR